MPNNGNNNNKGKLGERVAVLEQWKKDTGREIGELKKFKEERIGIDHKQNNRMSRSEDRMQTIEESAEKMEKRVDSGVKEMRNYFIGGVFAAIAITILLKYILP